jgi:hypothetical protein
MVPIKKREIAPIIQPFPQLRPNRRHTTEGQIGYSRCDRCNAPTHIEVIRIVDDALYLCPMCYQLYQAIPEGCLKRSIRRFLIGNVV